MKYRILPLLTLCGLAFPALPLQAQELLPPDRPIAEVIDHYIGATLKKEGITPAPPADEATLVRRLTLDLAGRIPTPDEVKQYLAAKDPLKKAKLIERLMASPEYVRHGATEFDALLAGDNDKAPSLRKYLLTALEENRPWDQMFREMIGVQPAEGKPETFVLGRLREADDLTRDVSSVFFGMNITCAQCHNHPYVNTITQDYFYGMKLFFSRSIEFGGQLLERQYPEKSVEYKAKNGQIHKAKLVFLSGTTLDEPALAPDVDLTKVAQEETKLVEKFKNNFAKEKTLPPKPEFSYREQLAKVALQPKERMRFARSLVNRVWYRFHGYGLVMRLDQMHSSNPPTHPDLLEWLARDFVAHNYDLRRLVHGLVSSQTYARSSRWEQEDDAPDAELYAVARVRPLSPQQYSVSQLMLAKPDVLPSPDDMEIFGPLYDRLEREGMRIFGKLIEKPRDGLQINVTEALLLSNDITLLTLQGSKLISELLALKDRAKQVEMAVWWVLSRPPTEAEKTQLSEYLAQEEAKLPDLSAEERQQLQDKQYAIEKARLRSAQIQKQLADGEGQVKDKGKRDMLLAELAQLRELAEQPLPRVSPFESRTADALHLLVWALLNSPEFRFNY